MSPDFVKHLLPRFIPPIHVLRASHRNGIELLKFSVPIVAKHRHEVSQTKRTDFVNPFLPLPDRTRVLHHGWRDVLTPPRVPRPRLRILHVVMPTTERRLYIVVRPTERANDVEAFSGHIRGQNVVNDGLLAVFFDLVLPETGTNFTKTLLPSAASATNQLRTPYYAINKPFKAQLADDSSRFTSLT